MHWKIHFVTLIVVLLFLTVIHLYISEIRIHDFSKGTVENILKNNERCGFLYVGNKPRYVVVTQSYDIIPLGILTRNHLLIGNINTQEIRVFSKLVTLDIFDRLGMMGVSWLDSVIAELLYFWGDSNSFIFSKDRKLKIENGRRINERDDIMKLIEQVFNAV